MKAKFMLMCTMMLVIMFGFVASANAQQSICNIAAVTPLSGAAGSSVNASGGLSGGDVTVLWDGTAIATIPNDGMTGAFSGNFTVPADAAPGIHTIILSIPSEGTYECPFTFTVVASVQTDAYTAATAAALPVTLPSTGLFMIIPVAGLAAAGIGGVLLRRRSNS
ncbi:MAG: LPXTG cell wall anchor domain-containing protein [Thermoleophilia bacterium]